MGLLTQLFQPSYRASSPGPLDDFWYTSLGGSYGGQSVAGMQITEDTAMRASAVWACVRVISETLATVPLLLYHRLPDGRRERAAEHYLFSVLHDRANEYQTAFEFKEMMTAHCLLTGNAYARLVPGRRGSADQLMPLHPYRMSISALNGVITYRYQEPTGRTSVYQDDEIFHLRGLSNGGGLSSLQGTNTDGRLGMSVLQYARDSIGLALATESHGARLFSQGARPGGVLTHPGKLSKESKAELKDNWQAAHSGLAQAHKTAVLEEGMKWEQIGMTSEDAQFLETRQFQVSDIARWFRVPLHMIQEVSKETSWGTGIEQLSLAFVIYTLLPWARRWEQAISRDLINQSNQFYCEYLFDSLLRGDQKSRYESYAVGRNWGWLSTNDIRRLENMEPIENGDVYLQPLNMVEAGSPPAQPQPAPSRPAEVEQETAHYGLLLHEAAARVIRKEIAAMTKTARRCAGDVDQWRAEIDAFYAEHAGYVAQTLRIDAKLAAWYCGEQRAMLLKYGAAALEQWEERSIDELVAIVKGAKT